MSLLIGAHTSAAGGVHNALYEGQRIGATTIQFFTSNQKQWKGRVFTEEMLAKWKQAREETGLEKLMCHDSYLINLGSPKEESLEKSRRGFREEIERCLTLDLTYMNFHPGAALDSPVERCIETIIESLLSVEDLVAGKDLRLLLETTAGQGSTVGHEFEHLKSIIDGVQHKIPIGVCIDTCHIFAAGYDIRTEEACEKTLQEFDQVVGLEHLFAFHINDSKKALGTRVDRHDCLGKGEIGLEAFRFLMKDPRTKTIPKYLETPGGTDVWVDEIQLLREMGA